MGNERRALAQYPAAFPGVIAVGATGPDDHWVKIFPWDDTDTKGSNFGTHISVCAPGNIIYGLHHSSSMGNYDSYWSGTSQAAPHVAGVCALLLAQDPERKPADLKRLLEDGAEDGVGDAPGYAGFRYPLRVRPAERAAQPKGGIIRGHGAVVPAARSEGWQRNPVRSGRAGGMGPGYSWSVLPIGAPSATIRVAAGPR